MRPTLLLLAVAACADGPVPDLAPGAGQRSCDALLPTTEVAARFGVDALTTIPLDRDPDLGWFCDRYLYERPYDQAGSPFLLAVRLLEVADPRDARRALALLAHEATAPDPLRAVPGARIREEVRELDGVDGRLDLAWLDNVDPARSGAAAGTIDLHVRVALTVGPFALHLTAPFGTGPTPQPKLAAMVDLAHALADRLADADALPAPPDPSTRPSLAELVTPEDVALACGLAPDAVTAEADRVGVHLDGPTGGHGVSVAVDDWPTPAVARFQQSGQLHDAVPLGGLVEGWLTTDVIVHAPTLVEVTQHATVPHGPWLVHVLEDGSGTSAPGLSCTPEAVAALARQVVDRLP